MTNDLRLKLLNGLNGLDSVNWCSVFLFASHRVNPNHSLCQDSQQCCFPCCSIIFSCTSLTLAWSEYLSEIPSEFHSSATTTSNSPQRFSHCSGACLCHFHHCLHHLRLSMWFPHSTLAWWECSSDVILIHLDEMILRSSGWNWRLFEKWGEFFNLAIAGVFMISLEMWAFEISVFLTGNVFVSVIRNQVSP